MTVFQAAADVAEARAESKAAAGELLKLHRELGEVRSTQQSEARQLRRDSEVSTVRLQVCASAPRLYRGLP